MKTKLNQLDIRAERKLELESLLDLAAESSGTWRRERVVTWSRVTRLPAKLESPEVEPTLIGLVSLQLAVLSLALSLSPFPFHIRDPVKISNATPTVRDRRLMGKVILCSF